MAFGLVTLRTALCGRCIHNMVLLHPKKKPTGAMFGPTRGGGGDSQNGDPLLVGIYQVVIEGQWKLANHPGVW